MSSSSSNHSSQQAQEASYITGGSLQFFLQHREIEERMNLSSSDCSSGCDSGWTMYLGQSNTRSTTQCPREKSGILNRSYVREGEYQQEEDLSMVSDASSGPPNFQEDEDYMNQNAYVYSSGPVSKSENKRKNKGKRTQKSQLDDTASSHFYGISKKSLNAPKKQDSMRSSQGPSATQLKGKSATKNQYGFFKTGSSKEGGS